MDKALRSQFRNTMTACRLREGATAQCFELKFGIFQSGKVEDGTSWGYLSIEDQGYRQQVVIHLKRIKTGGLKTQPLVKSMSGEA